MSMRVAVLSVGLAGMLGVAGATAGQHEHQAGSAATPSSVQVTLCSQAQPVIMGLLDAALMRLEQARLTNSSAAMRDATDDVQTALVDVRAQLAPCAALQIASSEAHSEHATPAAPSVQTPAAPPTPKEPQQRPRAPAADPHAGHVAPASPPAAPRAPSAATRPSTAAPRSAAPVASDAHTEHALSPTASPQATPPAGVARATAVAPPTTIADLKCTDAVNPKTAPRMLYQGRMYYFCTEASRAEFAKDPAKYVTAPPQAAPTHAH
jgi:YHS domain-containing protein